MTRMQKTEGFATKEHKGDDAGSCKTRCVSKQLQVKPESSNNFWLHSELLDKTLFQLSGLLSVGLSMQQLSMQFREILLAASPSVSGNAGFPV